MSTSKRGDRIHDAGQIGQILPRGKTHSVGRCIAAVEALSRGAVVQRRRWFSGWRHGLPAIIHASHGLLLILPWLLMCRLIDCPLRLDAGHRLVHDGGGEGDLITIDLTAELAQVPVEFVGGMAGERDAPDHADCGIVDLLHILLCEHFGSAGDELHGFSSVFMQL